MQSWGLICGQLCILGDSGTGAAVAVVVVVVAEVVRRYQKGQWKRHEHLYNKAIIWGLNISHSEKTPLLFLPMTVPTKVLQTAKLTNVISYTCSTTYEKGSLGHLLKYFLNVKKRKDFQQRV